MAKLIKGQVEIKVGDAFLCKVESFCFTKGRVYKVIDSHYNNGSGSFEIHFLDDDCDQHMVRERFLGINFEKQ